MEGPGAHAQLCHGGAQPRSAGRLSPVVPVYAFGAKTKVRQGKRQALARVVQLLRRLAHIGCW